MLTEQLINTLRQDLITDPKKAAAMVAENPKILEVLLQSEEDRVKYIKMSTQMEQQLRETAERLKTTQGVLIGVGLLFLLALFKK